MAEVKMIYAIFKVIKWTAYREATVSLIGFVKMNLGEGCLVHDRFDIVILAWDH